MGRTSQMARNTVVELACFAAVVLFLFGLFEGLPWLYHHFG